MAKYAVEVEETIVYRIEVDASSSREAMDKVDFMIEDGAMPKDIGEYQDDQIDTIHSYLIETEGATA